MQILIYTYISVLLHYSHWGLSCFQSLKTLPFTAAKEMTREEKHSQCISAINSIHNCPAVCAWRNWPVSPPSFGHWKLIWHFWRCGLLVTRQECARDHSELKEKKWNPDWSAEYLCYEDKVIWGRGRSRGEAEPPAKPSSACRTQPSLAETRWDDLRNLHVYISSAKTFLRWPMSDRWIWGNFTKAVTFTWDCTFPAKLL